MFREISGRGVPSWFLQASKFANPTNTHEDPLKFEDPFVHNREDPSVPSVRLVLMGPQVIETS